MSVSAKHTVQISAATKERLTELAGKTQRAIDVLAEDAIEAYVARELAITARIEAARDNVRAGHFTSHEDVIVAAFAVIDAAEQTR